MGGIGIMAASFFGGMIYDGIGHTAPFTMMGILNGVLLLFGMLVRLRSGQPAIATAAIHPAES